MADPADLARRPTGRGGAGSDAAKIEQRIIIDLLDRAMAHAEGGRE